MTKYYSFFAVAFLFVALALGSCQNQVDGCTDPTALNYDPNATDDDGSCQYATANNEAGLVFWFSESSANGFIGNQNITSLKFIVDGVDEGTHFMTVFDSVAPACDAVNHITVKRTVPQGTTRYIPYVLEDQNGNTPIGGSFPFVGGSCLPIEVVD